MSSTTRTRYRDRTKNLDAASRCPHCREERVCALLSDFQALNALYPIPGVFSILWDIEQLFGSDIAVTACIGCACFQPVGILPRHAH